jgi:hypothetical protein
VNIQIQDHTNYLHNETIVSLVHNHLGSARGEHCKQLLDNNSGQFVLAIADNYIVGCACYGLTQFQAQTWWLGFCVVEPEFRNLGISNQLVDYRLNKIGVGSVQFWNDHLAIDVNSDKMRIPLNEILYMSIEGNNKLSLTLRTHTLQIELEGLDCALEWRDYLTRLKAGEKTANSM